MIGSYKARQDIPVRLNNSVFTLSKGAIVAVTKEDIKRDKVLIEFGPRDVDWFRSSFLVGFERLD